MFTEYEPIARSNPAASIKEDSRKEFAEALQIRRELAQKNPETYRSDVAGTLNDLGRCRLPKVSQ
jgi:hypothetical protein